jgi:hypothetical protein
MITKAGLIRKRNGYLQPSTQKLFSRTKTAYNLPHNEGLDRSTIRHLQILLKMHKFF